MTDNNTQVSGEFRMTDKDFRQISAIMHAQTGVVLDETKTNLVYSRLAKRLRLLRLPNFAEYCGFIDSPDGGDEREAMIAALTTNVTRFFREPHHFEHLKNSVLPALLEQARQGGKIRLWSAACSSGQEPYSMALTVLALAPDAAKHDIKILATDIDHNMIDCGEAGIYEASLMADIPDASRRWFGPEPARPGHFSAGRELRALVHFRKLNLIGDWPMQGKYQAIFCRNVVIYFDDATKTKIWDRMIRLLDSNSALYIGHSERIGGQAERLLYSDGITTYRPIAGMPGARMPVPA